MKVSTKSFFQYNPQGLLIYLTKVMLCLHCKKPPHDFIYLFSGFKGIENLAPLTSQLSHLRGEV